MERSISLRVTTCKLATRDGTRLVAHLAGNLGYPAEPRQLMELYGLDDMWDIGAQTLARTHDDVVETAGSLIADHEAAHQRLELSGLTRIARLLVP